MLTDGGSNTSLSPAKISVAHVIATQHVESCGRIEASGYENSSRIALDCAALGYRTCAMRCTTVSYFQCCRSGLSTIHSSLGTAPAWHRAGHPGCLCTLLHTGMTLIIAASCCCCIKPHFKLFVAHVAGALNSNYGAQIVYTNDSNWNSRQQSQQ